MGQVQWTSLAVHEKTKLTVRLGLGDNISIFEVFW
jgi:hypothetical protein